MSHKDMHWDTQPLPHHAFGPTMPLEVASLKCFSLQTQMRKQERVSGVAIPGGALSSFLEPTEDPRRTSARGVARKSGIAEEC